MAKLQAFTPTVTVTATLTLDLAEIAALDALAGYGTDEFLKVFYAKLGEAYLKPHEAGLRSLFDTIRGDASRALGSVRQAERTLAESKAG